MVDSNENPNKKLEGKELWCLPLVSWNQVSKRMDANKT